MLAQIEHDPDLMCLMKLHETIQGVRKGNNDNSSNIKKLKEVFTELDTEIKRVSREQTNPGHSQIEKKKDDVKKK